MITTTTMKYEGAPRQNDVTRDLHDDMKNSSTSGRVALNPTTVSQTTGEPHSTLVEVRNYQFLSLLTL